MTGVRFLLVGGTTSAVTAWYDRYTRDSLVRHGNREWVGGGDQLWPRRKKNKIKSTNTSLIEEILDKIKPKSRELITFY